MNHESNMNPTWWIMMSDEKLLGFEIQMDLRFSVLIRLPTGSLLPGRHDAEGSIGEATLPAGFFQNF